MKNSIKIFALALIVSFAVSSSSFASSTNTFNDTAVAVDVEAKKDWILLAKQSEYLMNKNNNLPTAKAWLEESLEIQEDAYNLELMGDFYSNNNQEKEAIQYYIKAIEAIKSDDATINTEALQSKIVLAKH